MNRFGEGLKDSRHQRLLFREKTSLGDKGGQLIPETALGEIGQLAQTALFRDVHRRIAQHRGIEILREQRPENIVLRADLNHRQVFCRIESALTQVVTAGEIVGAAEASDPQPFAPSAERVGRCPAESK